MSFEILNNNSVLALFLIPSIIHLWLTLLILIYLDNYNICEKLTYCQNKMAINRRVSLFSIIKLRRRIT